MKRFASLNTIAEIMEKAEREHWLYIDPRCYDKIMLRDTFKRPTPAAVMTDTD